MPRRPTQKVRVATAALRKLATRRGGGALPLPTSRDLAAQWEVHHSTIFRILVELSQEGVVWQHPHGRFYPASAQKQAGHNLPIAFLGRQMKQWSFLYQEILEGISEVCASSGSPLILLSSERLVEHDTPATPPRFSTPTIQSKEIQRLLAMVPKSCAGVIFDHLWQDRVLRTRIADMPSSVLLLRPSVLDMKTVLPDYAAGAVLALRHIVECGYEEVQLVMPFAHDPPTNQYNRVFNEHFALAGGKMRRREIWDCTTPKKRAALVRKLRRTRKRVAVLVPEDNVAILLHQEMEAQGIDLPWRVGIISLQGTAGPSSPLTRVRYDYRRMGRMAAGILRGVPQKDHPFAPALITGRTTLELPTMAWTQKHQ